MWKILASLSLCSSLLAVHGWIMPELYVGKQHILGQVSTLVGLAEPDDGLIFGYGRGTLVGNDCFEADLGLGYRKVLSHAVVGGYAFYDIFRSDKRRTFQQIALGLEAYTVRYVARINGYIPLTDVQGVRGEGARLVGSQVLLSSGADMAASYGGIDAEVGIRFFSCWEDWGCPELRLFGGGYALNRTGQESLAGFKGRAELHFYDLLVSGSEISVGVEAFRHDLRAGQLAGFLRFQIPFGGRVPRCCCLQSNCCLLCDRLYERIESLGITTRRIDDFCSGTAYFKGREISTAVVLRAGDDIVTIVPALPENALIVIDGTDGDIFVNDVVNMNPGHTITGGGSTITVNSPGCPDTPLTLPGIPGNIVRPNVLGNVINMDDNGTIINIGVTGGLDSISAVAAPDVMILDSRIATYEFATGVVRVRPIRIAFDSPRAMVARNQITIDYMDNTVGHRGIDIGGFNQVVEDSVIDELVLSPPGTGRAMVVSLFDSSVTGNTFNLIGGTGVRGFLSNTLVDSNTILGANGEGAMRIGSLNARISNNTFTTAPPGGVHSIYLRDVNVGTVLENNFVEAFGDNSTGITVDASSNITVRNNVIITHGDFTGSLEPAGLNVDSGVPNSLFEDNDVTTFGTFGHGINMQQNTNAIYRRNILRTNNTNARGIFLDITTSNLLFDSNEVTTTGATSPGIYSVDGTNNNITFTNNTFETATVGSHGAQLQNVDDFFLDGNSFSAPMADGLNLNNVDGIRAANNSFTNIGDDVIQITNTEVLTGSDGNTWDGSGTMDCNDGGGNTGSFIDFGSPNPFMCP